MGLGALGGARGNPVFSFFFLDYLSCITRGHSYSDGYLLQL